MFARTVAILLFAAVSMFNYHSVAHAQKGPGVGSYSGVSGKFGIYQMTKMDITKNSDGSTYTVAFDGERALKYDDATFVNGKLKIDDKGFISLIRFDGNKAIIENAMFPKNEWPVFEKVKK